MTSIEEIGPKQRPLRVVHLTGGLRAICQSSGDVQVAPSRAEPFTMRPKSYESTYREIEIITRESVLGVDFCFSDDNGKVYTDWQLWADWPTKSTGFSQRDRWGQVSYAAKLSKNDELAFDAECIRDQLTSLYLSVKRLSDEYEIALEHHLPVQLERNGGIFASAATLHIFAMAQLPLFGLASSIDYIVRFFCRHVLNMRKNIDSYRRYKDKDKDKVHAIFLKMDTEIERIFATRNLLIHNVPLVSLGAMGCTLREVVAGNLYSVSAQMPLLIEGAAEFRARLSSLYTFEDWREFRRGHPEKVDILRYTIGATKLIAKLAEEVLSHSPVTPQLMHIEA